MSFRPIPEKQLTHKFRASPPRLRKVETHRRWGRGPWQAKKKPVSGHFSLSLGPPSDVNSMTCDATGTGLMAPRSEWTSKERCSQEPPGCTWVRIKGLLLREAAPLEGCTSGRLQSTPALSDSSPAPLLFSQRATMQPCMLTRESWNLSYPLLEGSLVGREWDLPGHDIVGILNQGHVTEPGSICSAQDQWPYCPGLTPTKPEKLKGARGEREAQTRATCRWDGP